MKKRLSLFLLYALLLLAFGSGCKLGLPSIARNADEARTRAVVGDGASFQAGANPFIYNSSVKRNSSDPAALVTNIDGKDTLILVTSSDIKMPSSEIPTYSKSENANYYPMDSTYMYAWTPSEGMQTWHDFGAVVKEKQIDWADDDFNHMWAPDIDMVKGATKASDLYSIFVPNWDDSIDAQRIAVAQRSSDPFGPFTYKDYVHITGGGWNPDNYAYDPGVFSPDGNQYYMAFCDNECYSPDDPRGRNHITTFPDKNDLTKATYGGEFVFADFPYSDKDGHSTKYMEGPDLFRVPNNHGGPELIYLMFAAKLTDAEQEYIGYATMTPADFSANPVGPWQFRGWVQRPIDPSHENGGTSEWTNHNGFAVMPDPNKPGKYKYYFFYQYSEGDDGSNGEMRQVSMGEVDIDANGLIQGVRVPDPNPDRDIKTESLGNLLYPSNASAISVSIADDTPDRNGTITPRFFINNRSGADLSNFTVRYFFTMDVGNMYPVLTRYWVGDYNATLRHIAGRVWAVDLVKSRLNAGDYYPHAECGVVFALTNKELRVSMDRSNDFSKTVDGNAYSDMPCVAVYNSDGELIAGSQPAFVITSEYYPGSGRTLTCTNDYQIKGQPFVAHWDTQRWYLQPIPGSERVKLQNVFNKKYLTYELISGERRKFSCEDYKKTNGQSFELDSRIVPEEFDRIGDYGPGEGEKRYITLGNPADTSGDRSDWISVWNQYLHLDWASQKWRMEVK